MCRSQSVTRANEMLHARHLELGKKERKKKTAFLVHIRIWEIPKIHHLLENRVALCGTAVIKFWEFC